MFGFLQLKSCGLDEEQRRIYRSHFCSVCHAMTGFGGKVSSLLTNYDITFWLLLQSALDSRPVKEIEQKPCTAVFFRKVDVRPLDPRVSKAMAAINLCLVGAKVEDDLQDGEIIVPKTANFLLGKNFRKAEEYLKELAFPLDTLMGLPQAQSEVEGHDEATVESLARPTADCMAEVFCFISTLHENPEIEEPLRQFGHHLGSYLYLWDALQDLEQDRKKSQFNAIDRAYPEGFIASDLRLEFQQHLDGMREILSITALGPEGDLCFQLLDTLQGKLRQSLPLPKVSKTRLPGQDFDKAGLCVLDCCECGSCCDVDCCDCNPCDAPSGACCEVNCCGCCSCCECENVSCCCDGSDLDCCDSIYCCDVIWCIDSSSTASRSVSSSKASFVPKKKKGFFSNKKMGLGRVKLPVSEEGDGIGPCPSCDRQMLQIKVGAIEVDECRNCGGIWLDDKELEALAKIPTLPHNLLNRYAQQTTSMRSLPGERTCPRCKTDDKLSVVPYLDVPVEMCRTCHGFWTEHGVLRKIIKAKRSPRKLMKSHRQEWRCPYCEMIAEAGSDSCQNCGGPRPKSGFTGKLG